MGGVADTLGRVALAAAAPAYALAVLALTDLVRLPLIARYDLLLLLFLGWAVWTLVRGTESLREFGLILVFHLLGTGLELFKVNVDGGWTYPEPGVAMVGGVPLYAGFLYASIGSFLLSLHKRLEVHLTDLPRLRWVALLAALIYGNFIANHWLWDGKPLLLLGTAALFWRTRVHSRAGRAPLVLLFPVLGVSLWLAENWGTWFATWQYPRQVDGWTVVPPDKLLSWTALVVVSTLVVLLARGPVHALSPHRPRARP